MNESVTSTVGVWNGGWDEEGLREFAVALRQRLGRHPVTLGLVFVTPGLFDHAAAILELLRVHAQVPVLAGCSTNGLIADGRELEEVAGLVLGLYSLPGATVRVVPVGNGDDLETGVAAAAEAPAGWLAFLEPFHTDAEAWIESWQRRFPQAPVYGGLATGGGNERRAQVYCNGDVLETGGVALGFAGVRLLGIVAQGCTPVGDTWTITRAEGNVIQHIGNRPAVAVLEETFAGLDEETRARSRGGLFAGLATDEYREEHHRGDFLVRNLVGADPESGALAVAALARPGQTMQFQLRDAAAADEELRLLLGRLRDRVGRARIHGGCLCTCVGRGQALFGEPDHDASLVRQMIGPVTIAGFFCNGEFGPIGPRSFVHGYTASLVLFAGPPRSAEDEL